ncbi:MAG: MFS transporter [Flavobacteriales bacterium]|jgi:FSR family fosmidomycin resistance protein-like MFS transporter|nr:MFS transporter [Flavobacteriales bacterium]MCI1752347.1 MFS transporter [Flavobacteriales bacterium]
MSTKGTSSSSIAGRTVVPVLIAISASHMLNDIVQSLIPAIYPIVKDKFALNFTQVGLITLCFQMTASILQPFVGRYTDKHPKPYSLMVGMCFTLAGVLALWGAGNFIALLLSVMLVGVGSSIFHPESSRIANAASGGKRGLAQSVFQLGGTFGSSLGPLLAALIVVPYGLHSLGWFAAIPLIGLVVVQRVGTWYKRTTAIRARRPPKPMVPHGIPRATVQRSIVILLVLVFSKQFYLAGMSSYYTFYLMGKFGLGIQQAQIHLFIFLFSAAIGTLIGGPLGDRYGRKYVIWFSILGSAPFTLLLPYANLMWTGILSAVIGLVLSSAFSAILVYAQELVPGKVGMVSGLFFGFAFGMAGIGSALLGALADHTSIEFIFKVCAFLPLIGLLATFLPRVHERAG